jgi:hypothetical protein
MHFENIFKDYCVVSQEWSPAHITKSFKKKTSATGQESTSSSQLDLTALGPAIMDPVAR